MHREDPEKVNGLFEEFEQADNAQAKQRIIGVALTEPVLSKQETELVNPEILPDIDNDDRRDGALIEQHGDKPDDTPYTLWNFLRPDG